MDTGARWRYHGYGHDINRGARWRQRLYWGMMKEQGAWCTCNNHFIMLNKLDKTVSAVKNNFILFTKNIKFLEYDWVDLTIYNLSLQAVHIVHCMWKTSGIKRGKNDVIYLCTHTVQQVAPPLLAACHKTMDVEVINHTHTPICGVQQGF